MISIVRGGADSISLRSLAIPGNAKKGSGGGGMLYILYFASLLLPFFSEAASLPNVFRANRELEEEGKNVGHVHGLLNKSAKKYSVSTLLLSNNQGRNREKIREMKRW